MKARSILSLLSFVTVVLAHGLDLSRSFYYGYDAQGKRWDHIREERPLTDDERQRMTELAELPAAEAVPRLAWHLTGSINKEASQLARELFLKLHGWKEVMSGALAEAAKVKTPEQAFGAEFERRRFQGKLTAEEERALGALGSLVDARLRQQELFGILRALQSPEAVPIVAPYLFDDAKRVRQPRDPFSPATADSFSFVDTTLRGLVPDLPKWNAAHRTEEEYRQDLRQWWLTNAHRYGADPNLRPAPLANSTAYANTPPPPAAESTPQPAKPPEPKPVAAAEPSERTARKPLLLMIALLTGAVVLAACWAWKRRR